jgi:hypothetical protein
MVILIVHVYSIFALKSKGDPPISADPDSPCASPLAFELMQIKPRQTHILRGRRCVKPTQNQANSIRMRRLDSRTRTAKKEPLEATVLESSDHASDCNLARYGLQMRGAPPPNVGDELQAKAARPLLFFLQRV